MQTKYVPFALLEYRTMSAANFNFLSPKELITRYPQVQLLGWTEAKIMLYQRSFLLLGLPSTRSKEFLIDEFDFVELIRHTNEILEAHMVRTNATQYCIFDLLTPGEIVVEHPQITSLLGWDVSKIGLFYSGRLLWGPPNPSAGRSNKITRRSFEALQRKAQKTSLRRAFLIDRFAGESF